MAPKRRTAKKQDAETQTVPIESEENERRLYSGVRDALQSYFCPGSIDCLFEVTAEGVSNELQGKLRDEILFLLGSRELRPDILGHVKHPIESEAFYYHEFFVAAEVKEGAPTVNDLFQAKKYGEIYEAAITLLVSTEKPEERLLRLLKRNSVLLHLPMSMFSAYLCKFSAKDGNIDRWFPEQPKRDQPTKSA
jgi:hypothetical protein